MVKKELNQKAKLLIYWSIFVPTLTYGYKIWIETERTRSQIQVAEIGFLWKVAGLSLRDRVRSLGIWKELSRSPSHEKEPAEVVWALG